ncbi:MAG TPA: patatin-like phospholipase family protein [candidate division Zixibacteria bacterium]|nr:patatin-like phospholipase family protein [candidate division Zixibacteria bacterium]
MTKRILAIDGGGVRGVIPAVLLSSLEAATGGRAREQFDLVAGTSTGALLAAGVAARVPAAEMVDLYQRRAPRVFRRTPLLSTLRRIAVGHMYDVGRLHRLIGRTLADHGAGEWTLNDVGIDVMFTAKGLVDSHQWYFVNDRPQRNSCRTGTLRLDDCLTASAAAPTFFAPWTVRGLEARGPMVDGGTGVAGNPVYQACVEAFQFSAGYDPADTIVVSLGTGHFLGRRRPTWLWSWVGWLLTELLRSPGEQQTELVDRHWPSATFYRIDVELPRDYPMDDARNIAALRDHGEQLAAEVDWPAILDGRDEEWLVRRRGVRPPAYAEPV